jgi:PKD repeat protein
MKKNICFFVLIIAFFNAISIFSQWIDKGKYKQVDLDIMSNNFSIQNDTIIRDSWIDIYNHKSVVKDFNINTGIVIDSAISDLKSDLKSSISISYSVSINNSEGLFSLITRSPYDTSKIYYFSNKDNSEYNSAFLYDRLVKMGNTGVGIKNFAYKQEPLTNIHYFLFSYTSWESGGGHTATWDLSKLILCDIENNKISNLQQFNFGYLNTNFLFSENKDEIIFLSNYTANKKINNVITSCRIKAVASYNLAKNEYNQLFETYYTEYSSINYNNCFEHLKYYNDEVFSFNSKFYFYNLSKKTVDSINYKNNIEYFTLYNNSPLTFVKSGKNFYFTNIKLGNIIDSLTFDSDFRIMQHKWIGDKLFLSCSDGKLRCFDINNYILNKIDFSADKLIAYTKDEINFIPMSNKKINTVQWDFGDGTYSNLINPAHVYTFPGKYTVTMIVSDGTKSDTIIKKEYIEITFPLKCDFTSNVTKGLPPLEVKFEDLSSGNILKYEWDFGDGITSTEKNPTHIYSEKGYYHVSLKVMDIINSFVCKKDFYINCDTVGIKEILEMEKLYLNSDNSDNIESVVELPLRGSEFYPGTDAIWLYHLNRILNGPPMPSFLQDYIEMVLIGKNSYNRNHVFVSKEWMNGEDVLKMKSVAFNNLYIHNFYPDSCNHNIGIFSQSIFPMYVTTIKNTYSFLYPDIKPNDTLRKFARMYNSKNLTISSFNYFPVELNKSIIACYSKQSAIIDNYNDIIFKQISLKNIEGNIVNFEKINNNEFIAPVTYFKANKNIIDIIKINALGEIISKKSLATTYPSLYLHHFIKLNDNEFIACGVAGDSVTLGKGYLLAIDASGNLIKEITFDNDVVNFKKLIRFNDNEFAALFDTKSDNKGYYSLDNNLSIKSNNRFKAINYEITDFYLTSAKELKFLVVENKNIGKVLGIINPNELIKASLITTIPENEITTDVNISEDFTKSNNFTISPNPATDFIEIHNVAINPTIQRGAEERYSVDDGSGIQIFDMLGVTVSNPTPTLPASREGVRIDVSYLSTGIYFIKIGNKVEKFVKM